MGLIKIINAILWNGAEDIPSSVKRFIVEVNRASKVRTTDPNMPIGQVMEGYQSGVDTIVEFYRRMKCLGIMTQKFDFNPSYGHLRANNWYFHINDILPTIEGLKDKGTVQITGIDGVGTEDMFDYSNQYGPENDYGRIFVRTGIIDGRLLLENRALKVELNLTGPKSSVTLPYNRSNNSQVRRYAVKIGMDEVNKRKVPHENDNNYDDSERDRNDIPGSGRSFGEHSH